MRKIVASAIALVAIGSASVSVEGRKLAKAENALKNNKYYAQAQNVVNALAELGPVPGNLTIAAVIQLYEQYNGNQADVAQRVREMTGGGDSGDSSDEDPDGPFSPDGGAPVDEECD